MHSNIRKALSYSGASRLSLRIRITWGTLKDPETHASAQTGSNGISGGAGHTFRKRFDHLEQNHTITQSWTSP